MSLRLSFLYPEWDVNLFKDILNQKAAEIFAGTVISTLDPSACILIKSHHIDAFFLLHVNAGDYF